MALRTHITELEHRILAQLPLNGQVVLGRILRPQVGLKFTIEEDRTEDRQVHRLAPGWTEYASKWVWTYRRLLAYKWRIEESFRQRGTASEWWLRTKLGEHQLFN